MQFLFMPGTQGMKAIWMLEAANMMTKESDDA